jgi:GTP-binding protein
MRAPVLAIVGRPNVGKSTLFNRLAGRRLAIVEDLPGVTRDRLYAECRTSVEIENLEVPVRWTIIDTGGFEPEPSSSLFKLVREQTELAIGEADVIVHVVDAQAGVSPDDAAVARMLRKSGRPVIVAANKIDHKVHEPLVAELYNLGVERVLGVSAEHGRGISPLLELAYSLLPVELQESAKAAAEDFDDDGRLTDEVLDHALDSALDVLENDVDEDVDLDAIDGDSDVDGDTDGDDVDDDSIVGDRKGDAKASPLLRAVPEVLRLAVVGRPNAGKSSFINKLLGEDRHVVSEIAGTTMDAIDSFVEYGGARFRLIDTAGIRRKRSIAARVEKFAVVAALRGMDRADIVLHVIDAVSGVTDQDKRIASFVEEKGKACILIINKWDLARDQNMDADLYTKQVKSALPFLDHAPVRYVSALTGRRVHDVLATAQELADRHFQRVSTGQVNRVLHAATEAHQPPMNKGRRIKLYFATQVKTAPPTFVIATNDVDGMHFSYRRFLVNQFREAFDFGGAPVRLIFRRREGDRLKNLSPAQKMNRKILREAHADMPTKKSSPRPKPAKAAAPKKAKAKAKAAPKASSTKKASTKKASKKAPSKKKA